MGLGSPLVTGLEGYGRTCRCCQCKIKEPLHATSSVLCVAFVTSMVGTWSAIRLEATPFDLHPTNLAACTGQGVGDVNKCLELLNSSR